jgi:two-component system response regulator NreC
MTIRIILVDDHAVVRSGLNMILSPEEDVKIVAEAGTAGEAIELACQEKPDVMLMDIHLPDLSGIEATKVIKEKCPDVAIVALTIHEDEEYFFKMLEAGASGYVPKRVAPEELLIAIRVASRGEVYIDPSLTKLLVKDFITQQQSRPDRAIKDLTERETELLAHLADGATNTEIADTLHISPKTVARHRENIMRKLDLRNRTELVKFAIRKGIIKP